MTSVSTQPEVSVVVVSWNTRDLTLACLRSILAGVPAGSPSVEVVLVDNASNDDTVDAVTSSLAHVRVIRLEENAGFARAANRGIAETSGRFVLLVNSDADLSRDSVSNLSAILEARPDAGAVGAALVGPDGELQFSCGRFLNPVNQCAESLGLAKLVQVSWLRRTYSSSELCGEAVAVDWCVGACLMIRRSALDDVGVFDERFFMYSEDEDLCLRLHRSGWTVLYAPKVTVAHLGGGSARRVLDRMRSEARASQNAFMRKHFGVSSALSFRMLMALARLKPRRDDKAVGWGR